MHDKKQAGNAAKKGMLKSMLKGGKPNKDGASPIAMDGGLGKEPLTPKKVMGGNGSNLGKKLGC